MYYAEQLHSNSNKATKTALKQGDIVLIDDLASSCGRSDPSPVLSQLIWFMDNSNSQAVIRYHGGQVDRPVGKLVRMGKSREQISEKG